jgi:hypothetical protein
MEIWQIQGWYSGETSTARDRRGAEAALLILSDRRGGSHPSPRSSLPMCGAVQVAPRREMCTVLSAGLEALLGRRCGATTAPGAAFESGGYGPCPILPLRRRSRCAAARHAPLVTPILSLDLARLALRRSVSWRIALAGLVRASRRLQTCTVRRRRAAGRH